MQCAFVKGKECPASCYNNKDSQRTGLADLGKELGLEGKQSNEQHEDHKYFLMMGLASYNELPKRKSFACYVKMTTPLDF